MSDRDLEFKMSGTHVPNGEIGLADLAAIATALQELATRIGRFTIDQAGPGRTKSTVETLTRLRLKGIDTGSTRLFVSYGQPDVLPIDVELERETEARFVQIVEALSDGSRPTWAPDPVAESALALLEAFKRAAGQVEFIAPLGRSARIETATAPRAPWSPPRAETGVASATGRLEAVDLKSEKFRIRDDVGNAITLGHVVNAAEVAHLINSRVTATGESTRGTRGELRSLESVRIEAAPLPEAWRAGQPSGWVAPTDKPGPDPDGGADLTEDEFADFLASIKGSSRPMNGV